MKKYGTLLFLCWIFLFTIIASASCAALSARESKHSKACPAVPFPLPDSLTDQVDLSVLTGLGHACPGYSAEGGILLENLSFQTARYLYLYVSLDTTANLQSCNFPYQVVSPGNLLFQFDSLAGQEKIYLNFGFMIPPVMTLVGQQLRMSASVTNGLYDYDPGNNSDSTRVKITGSYDPNVKAVDPEGFGIPNYVPMTQEEFSYTINFQNTGTDTAYNITITDTLSAYLDPLTIKAGASSHPYSWEILSPCILKFHFNGINLPDSSVNEPRSHGFVTYSIGTVHGLPAGTVIKNMAQVYFDFNAPVSTNTTTNELFNCDSITSFSTTTNMLCGGDQLVITQTGNIPHQSFWYIDSLFQTSADTFVFQTMIPGLHQVILLAQTPFCDQTITASMLVIVPVKPVITTSGNLLTASPALHHQWYTGGMAIPGAVFINYIAPQDGWYRVQTTDISGCTAMSDSVYFSSVGLSEGSRTESFNLSPNPFSDKLTLRLYHINEEVSIRLQDAQGRLLFSMKAEPGSHTVEIPVSGLEHGLYSLTLSGERMQESRTVCH